MRTSLCLDTREAGCVSIGDIRQRYVCFLVCHFGLPRAAYHISCFGVVL